MPTIELTAISKRFRMSPENTGDRKILDDISVSIRHAEFVTLFGPNGCGKTTLLNILAGLLGPDNGIVRISSSGPQDYRIGYVFQNYVESLFPWLTVLENIAFSLRLRGLSRLDRKSKVVSLLELIEISLPLDKYPYQLSGGQKQLVAIARALAHNPEILILDEPFTSLDYRTRYSMYRIIQDLWAKLNLTVLFVSHEIDEAILLADRLLLLSLPPSRIKKDITVDIARPRHLEVLASQRFFEIKAQVINEFKGEISR